jgi:hypothetical protein
MGKQMSIESFGEKHRVKVRKDTDGTLIVAGKLGHIYEHSAEKLGVLFMSAEPRARLWNTVKAKGKAAGMTVRQNGDAEGTMLFDPANPEQARLAMKLVRVRAKRLISEAQRLALFKARSKRAEIIAPEGGSAARNAGTQKNALQGTKAA